ncbi:hypothetical protein [Marinobacter sp.]|jgi:hypothetical protein|uniref:hypothetical protein n=1 Tax=Marinobacter sp. TaxID=50741 RepID=UPI002356E5B0|nr:hypothetical protein [Marinobacter sp.]|tara:strand:- start:2730 stop:2963 length:234 start_codon:yes stop_codon:yes gene_type:complete
MEEQSMINILGGLVAALIGWFVRVIWDNQSRVAKEIKETNKDIVNNYVRRDDYKDDIAEIKNMLTLIFQKLDGKVDK